MQVLLKKVRRILLKKCDILIIVTVLDKRKKKINADDYDIV